MNLLRSLAPGALSETLTPLVSLAMRHARVVSGFVFLQGLVQLIGFASGILLIRTLTEQEYALFTIANTMQGTMNILADIGISIGLVSIGGRVWQDPHRFGQLVTTALGLRRRLGALAIIVAVPLLYFLLIRNNSSAGYAAILCFAVVLGLVFQLGVGVLYVVPRLRADLRRIQKIDLTGAILRLAVFVLLAGVLLNAGIAVVVGSLTVMLQYYMLRHYVAGVIDLNAPVNNDDRKEIWGFIRGQAANAIFFCLQGQITIFLISIFGQRSTAVAEVGALGRLAMIFVILNNLLMNVLVPAFARCHEPRHLRRLYAGVVGGVVAFSTLILLGAAAFPREFLYVLGPKYMHLHRELLLIVAGTVFNALAATLWAMNMAKAWVRGSWLYIPLTIAVQLALIPFLDLTTVRGVLTFNLFSSLPILLINVILSFRGFRNQAQPV